jgi:hypothetical protein
MFLQFCQVVAVDTCTLISEARVSTALATGGNTGQHLLPERTDLELFHAQRPGSDLLLVRRHIELLRCALLHLCHGHLRPRDCVRLQEDGPKAHALGLLPGVVLAGARSPEPFWHGWQNVLCPLPQPALEPLLRAISRIFSPDSIPIKV